MLIYFLVGFILSLILLSLNWHVYLINLAEKLFIRFGQKSLEFTSLHAFTNDPPNYLPPPFSKHLSSTKHTLDNTQNPWHLHCTYRGEKRTSYIYPPTTYDPDKPTLIYHHGASEINHTHTYSLIFGSSLSPLFNIFFVKAQGHNSKTECFHQVIDSFSHYQQTFVGSVIAIENIIHLHRRCSNTPVWVVGYSMGGIVASLHAFEYQTADGYMPITAYPNFREIILGPAGTPIVNSWLKNHNSSLYTDHFPLPPLKESTAQKIFPILGENDSLIPYQKALNFWQNNQVKVLSFPYGHLTPIIKSGYIRSFINDKIFSNNKQVSTQKPSLKPLFFTPSKIS